MVVRRYSANNALLGTWRWGYEGFGSLGWVTSSGLLLQASASISERPLSDFFVDIMYEGHSYYTQQDTRGALQLGDITGWSLAWMRVNRTDIVNLAGSARVQTICITENPATSERSPTKFCALGNDYPAGIFYRVSAPLFDYQVTVKTSFGDTSGLELVKDRGIGLTMTVEGSNSNNLADPLVLKSIGTEPEGVHAGGTKTLCLPHTNLGEVQRIGFTGAPSNVSTDGSLNGSRSVSSPATAARPPV